MRTMALSPIRSPRHAAPAWSGRLALGRTGDAAEAEAERLALRTEQNRSLVQARPTAPASNDVPAPACIQTALDRPRSNLPEPWRRTIEFRLGQDFSRVRIHDDGAAHRSARAIHARAYTVGSDIVFGPGHFSPESTAGKALIAHELVHVAQNGPGSRVVRRSAESEPSGNDLINRIARGIGDGFAAGPVPLPSTAVAALSAASLGFVAQAYERLSEQDSAWRIAQRLWPLAVPPRSIAAGAQCALGFLEGIVSPITGLYHLFTALIAGASAAAGWLGTLPNGYPTIRAEAALLATSMGNVAGKAAEFLSSLGSAQGLQDFALALLEGGEAIRGRLVAAAQSAGRHAADSVAGQLLTAELDGLVRTVGVVAGTVTVEAVLLIFTDGIGNLITKIGEFARILSPLSRGAAAFAEVAATIGRWVSVAEGALAAVMARTVLRPLRPLLEAIQPLMLRIRAFGDAILHAGEAAVSRAVARAAASAETRAVGTAVERTAVPAVAAPRVPASTTGPRATTSATTPVREAPALGPPASPTSAAAPVEPRLPAGTGGDIDEIIGSLDRPGQPFRAEGPLVAVPVRPQGNPARVLEIGAGTRRVDIGVPPEGRLVPRTRTDLRGTRPPSPTSTRGVQRLDANQPIPANMRGQFDTVVINNPRGYTPDIARVGEAIRPGGRIIVQGRGRVPTIGRRQQQWNPDFQRLVDADPPPGWRKIVDLPPTSRAEDPANVLGGPFRTTSGQEIPTERINGRIIYEQEN